MDGKIEAKVKNTTPQHWRNVKVWMAEARHGFPPANVQIKNLEHINPGALPSVQTSATFPTLLLKSSKKVVFLSEISSK